MYIIDDIYLIHTCDGDTADMFYCISEYEAARICAHLNTENRKLGEYYSNYIYDKIKKYSDAIPENYMSRYSICIRKSPLAEIISINGHIYVGRQPIEDFFDSYWEYDEEKYEIYEVSHKDYYLIEMYVKPERTIDDLESMTYKALSNYLDGELMNGKRIARDFYQTVKYRAERRYEPCKVKQE